MKVTGYGRGGNRTWLFLEIVKEIGVVEGCGSYHLLSESGLSVCRGGDAIGGWPESG